MGTPPIQTASYSTFEPSADEKLPILTSPLYLISDPEGFYSDKGKHKYTELCEIADRESSHLSLYNPLRNMRHIDIFRALKQDIVLPRPFQSYSLLRNFKESTDSERDEFTSRNNSAGMLQWVLDSEKTFNDHSYNSPYLSTYKKMPEPPTPAQTLYKDASFPRHQTREAFESIPVEKRTMIGNYDKAGNPPFCPSYIRLLDSPINLLRDPKKYSETPEGRNTYAKVCEDAHTYGKTLASYVPLGEIEHIEVCRALLKHSATHTVDHERIPDPDSGYSDLIENIILKNFLRSSRLC